ncbi:MAG TPA: hypothetical protein VFX49_02430 [Chloroflexota bacterium]|nr:hypothetical protein [Chloroflexota bacterium]
MAGTASVQHGHSKGDGVKMIMRRTFGRGGAAVLLLFLLMAGFAPRAQAATSALTFRNDMRKLWEDHIQFTRMYIVSAAHDLPDKDATAARLLQNQTDIGNAIKPLYGDASGNQLTALLRDHILGAVDLIAAAKAGNTAAVNTASTRWYANANDIADFLSRANPRFWPQATARAEMKMHLDLTLQEAQDRLGGRFAADIQDYDRIHEHILHFADVLSSGIISQFPAQFDQTNAARTFPLSSAMRKLWEDHITWTRLYVISAAHDLPDKDATAARLLQNQTDIGNAIKTYYGNAAGDRLTALLRDHILGAVDLIAAAKANDQPKQQAASAAWYANANDIAAFLSAANPTNWPAPVVAAEMKMHLDVTLQEAVDRLMARYAADIQDYDRVHEHILHLADTLVAGIMAQFPGRFLGLPATGNPEAAPVNVVRPEARGGQTGTVPAGAIGVAAALAILGGGWVWTRRVATQRLS